MGCVIIGVRKCLYSVTSSEVLGWKSATVQLAQVKSGERNKSPDVSAD